MDFFARLSKCCGWGLSLDSSYNCVSPSVPGLESVFHQAFKDQVADGVKVEVEDNWGGCPAHRRAVLDIVNIPEDKNSADYAVRDLSINSATSSPLVRLGVEKISSECVELSSDLKTLISLVCLEQPGSKSRAVVKCCAPGWMLSSTGLDCELRPGPRDGMSVTNMTEELGNITLELGNMTLELGNTSCPLGTVPTRHPVTSKLSDGRILSESSLLTNQYHCLDRTEDASLAAVVCSPPSCADLEPEAECVSKCCAEDQIIHLLTDLEGGEEVMCVAPDNNNMLWRTTDLHDTDLVRIETTNTVLSTHFLDRDQQHCHTLLVQLRNTSQLLVSNGSLYQPDRGFVNQFCIDNAVTSHGEVLEMIVECHDVTQEPEHVELSNISCLEKHSGTFRLVNTISCSVSIVFLTITGLVYLLVPDLNNLHGKIILNNVLSITCLTVYLIIIYNTKHIFSDVLCILLGYFGYFSTISMFSWMTIMSFDLFWMFKQPKVPRRDSKIRKFLLYSVLAWGTSGLATLGVFLADTDSKVTLSDTIKPNIGRGKCFLQNSSHGIFLHLPIFIFMLVNGIFYLVTVLVLYR